MLQPSRHDFAIDNAVYKTLLESTKAIPWKIDWESKRFVYIGPQIETLLGWTPESWMTVEDWATRMHPEDQARVVNFCVSQSQSGVDHEADYRALTKDGSYVWIRDVVHVVRTPDGGVDSLIGFMFDISERKETEERLLTMQKELEALSFKDGLTGVANRRLFATTLDREWDAAARKQQPMSILLIDIDYFKQFNDRYGHVAGDDCLIAVAQALDQCATRPLDLVARYGGEEFVVLLPETESNSAFTVAERCRDAIAALNIAHANSSVAKHVTASIGVGCTTPSAAQTSKSFVDTVDAALYAAKNNGRNRIEVVAAH